MRGVPAVSRSAPTTATHVSEALAEDDQFVYLSGFQLAVTSSAAAIDLAVATLGLMHVLVTGCLGQAATRAAGVMIGGQRLGSVPTPRLLPSESLNHAALLPSGEVAIPSTVRKSSPKS
jgi:hypothetical protein